MHYIYLYDSPVKLSVIQPYWHLFNDNTDIKRLFYFVLQVCHYITFLLDAFIRLIDWYYYTTSIGVETLCIFTGNDWFLCRCSCYVSIAVQGSVSPTVLWYYLKYPLWLAISNELQVQYASHQFQFTKIYFVIVGKSVLLIVFWRSSLYVSAKINYIQLISKCINKFTQWYTNVMKHTNIRIFFEVDKTYKLSRRTYCAINYVRLIRILRATRTNTWGILYILFDRLIVLN